MFAILQPTCQLSHHDSRCENISGYIEDCLLLMRNTLNYVYLALIRALINFISTGRLPVQDFHIYDRSDKPVAEQPCCQPPEGVAPTHDYTSFHPQLGLWCYFM